MADDPLGSARLELVGGVVLLRPEDAVFEAMLHGWEMQQRGGRRLDRSTVVDRDRHVRRFANFTSEYPWRWTAGHMDEWTMHLMSDGAWRRPRSAVTRRRFGCSATSSPRRIIAGPLSARNGSARTRCRSATNGTPRSTLRITKVFRSEGR